ncbi:MAG: toxin-antitoxin system YwqK family antitoxin, partial [Opitutaceae bacterium]|nr:toxin-antitoxin system YwqK family antitoxin [Cytophagales bacterium]
MYTSSSKPMTNSKQIFIITIFLIVLPHSLFAQKRNTTFYNEYWEQTSKINAKYYSVITDSTTGKPEEVMKKYYLTGELAWEGKVSIRDSESKDSLCTFYHRNQKIKSIKRYVNGKAEGKVKGYHYTGELSYVYTCKNGIRIGGDTNFYENGQIESIAQYENGKVNGRSISWHKNGKVRNIFTYKQAVPHGPFISFWETGDTFSYEYYNNDVRTGKSVKFYANRQIKNITFYDDKGQGKEQIYFYENGNKEAHLHFLNNKREGECITWFNNGRLEKKEFYAGGERNGKSISYFKNGQIKSEEIYLNGRSEGEQRNYFPNGVLLLIVQKKEDRTKSYKFYYPSGILKSDVVYSENLTTLNQFRYNQRGKRIFDPPNELFVLSDSIVHIPSRNVFNPASPDEDEKTGLYKFKEEGRPVGHYEYTVVDYLSSGFYIVKREGKTGLLSPDGKETIPPEYDSLYTIRSEGAGSNESPIYYVAKKEGKLGLIDFENKAWIPFEYDEIRLLPGGLLLLKKNGHYDLKYGNKNICQTNFKEITGFKSENLIVNNQEGVLKNYGVADYNGKTVVPMQFKKIVLFDNGVGTYGRSGQGFWNLDGKLLLDTLYSFVGNREDGLFDVTQHQQKGIFHESGKWLVSLGDTISKANKIGDYILLDGKKTTFLNNRAEPMFKGKNWKHHQIVLYTESNNGDPYNFQCFIVKYKNNYLIVDSSGKRLFPENYQYARWTESNYLILVNKDKASTYTIQSGEFVPSENTNFIFAGLAINFGPINYVFDKKGEILLQSKEPIVEIKRTYFSGEIDKSIGYSIINKKGKSTLLLDSQKIDCPLRYQLVEEIDNKNLLVVTTKGKCGIINKKGGEVLKPNYAAISSYDSLFQGFWVAENIDTTYGSGNLFQKWGIVGSKGKYVFGPYYLQPANFKNGKAITKKMDKVGMIDINGRIIIPFNYDQIIPFQSDTADPYYTSMYVIRQDEKFGLADKNG